MKFTARLRTIDFGVSTYQRALQIRLEELMKDFVARWLTVTTGRIPLFTGMARGAFLKVSQLVNGRVVLSPLRASSRIPKGEALGQASLRVQGTRAEFSFASRVPHFVIQDLQQGISPTSPWRSLQAGEATFRDFVKEIKLPPLSVAIKTQLISK